MTCTCVHMKSTLNLFKHSFKEIFIVNVFREKLYYIVMRHKIHRRNERKTMKLLY